VAVVQYRLGAVCHFVTILLLSYLSSSAARIHGARWYHQPCRQGCYQCVEVLEKCCSRIWRKCLQDYPCWPEQWCQHDQSITGCSVRFFAVPFGYTSIGPDGNFTSTFFDVTWEHWLTIAQDYGFLAPPTQQKLQSSFNGLIGCTSINKSCWNSLSLDAILNAETTLFNDAASIDPSTGSFEPIRPVRDGSLITSPLDSTAPFPSVNKPVLISTVLNEAGPAIYGQFLQPLPSTMLTPICEASLGPNRTSTLLGSTWYPVVSSGPNGTIDARNQLQTMATDYMFKCSSWTFARAWVQHGGSAYLGLYTVGASYPGNDAIPYCTQPGVVCHQDDIEIVVSPAAAPYRWQLHHLLTVRYSSKSQFRTSRPRHRDAEALQGVPF
jgi:Carboxylesterase family